MIEHTPHFMIEHDSLCSQRSGAPVGPGGGTAKSPGPDRAAVIVEDGGPCKVRHFSVGDCRGRQGTIADYGGLRGTTGDYEGL